MEMQTMNSGKLRAIGYDRGQRLLRVELDNGSLIDHPGVGEELWRRLAGSGSAWSFYRDNIEEEFPGRRASGGSRPAHNPLDDLFGG